MKVESLYLSTCSAPRKIFSHPAGPILFLWGPRLGASPELGGTHVEGTPGS